MTRWPRGPDIVGVQTIMPARPRLSGHTLQFMRRLWELVHALAVSSKRMGRTLGVTGPQRLVLRVVGQAPDATASEISDLHIPVRICGVDEPGVVYRMDNVPIQFKSVIKGLEGVPSDEELFDKVYERMCQLTQCEPIWLAEKAHRKYPGPVVS